MLTEVERTNKKRNFICRKLDEIWKELEKCNTVRDNIFGLAKLVMELEASTFSVNGVGSVSKIEKDNTYRISDTSGECWIDISFSQNEYTTIMITFTVNMFDFQSPYCKYLNCNMHDFLSSVMLQFDKIKAEYLHFSENLEKSDKLTGLAQKSVKVWSPKILENSGYFYYIDELDNKSTLHIKLKHGLQLDIPIYYKKFQKIIPDLLTAIQQYENLVDSSDVKVLISTVKPKQYLSHDTRPLLKRLYPEAPKETVDVTKDCIQELQNMLNDNNYIYLVEREANKSTLHVRLKKGVQLDIKVYYRKFQTAAFMLQDVILQYKNLVESSDIRVLISTSSPKQKWEQ